MNIKKVAVLGAAAGMLIAAFGIETPLVKILTFGSVNLALAYSSSTLPLNVWWYNKPVGGVFGLYKVTIWEEVRAWS